MMKMSTFFLFCINIIIFTFSTALRKKQKIFACFPEEKLSTIYLDHQIEQFNNSAQFNFSKQTRDS